MKIDVELVKIGIEVSRENYEFFTEIIDLKNYELITEILT